MGLSCGMVGLPNVGRSTIFNAITMSDDGARSDYMFSTTAPLRGTVEVPDDRLAQINEHIETDETVWLLDSFSIIDAPFSQRRNSWP